MELLQRIRSPLPEPAGHSDGEDIQQSGGGGHGVVFLLLAAVGKQADIRLFFRRDTGTADKGEGP